MNHRGPEEIENERVQNFKDLEVAENAAEVVRERISRIEKCILVLGVHRKNLRMELDKGRHNVKVLKIQTKRLEVEFWQSKR